jgi:hypothetical protein
VDVIEIPTNKPIARPTIRMRIQNDAGSTAITC